MCPDAGVSTRKSFEVFYGVRDRLLGGKERYGTCCPSPTHHLTSKVLWLGGGGGGGGGLVLVHMCSIWTEWTIVKCLA